MWHLQDDFLQYLNICVIAKPTSLWWKCVRLEKNHILPHNFLYFDWFVSKYTECVENAQCAPHTVPRLPEILPVRDTPVIVISTDPFFALSNVVNTLHF